jgi:hypothetical protein
MQDCPTSTFHQVGEESSSVYVEVLVVVPTLAFCSCRTCFQLGTECLVSWEEAINPNPDRGCESPTSSDIYTIYIKKKSSDSKMARVLSGAMTWWAVGVDSKYIFPQWKFIGSTALLRLYWTGWHDTHAIRNKSFRRLSNGPLFVLAHWLLIRGRSVVGVE